MGVGLAARTKRKIHAKLNLIKNFFSAVAAAVALLLLLLFSLNAFSLCTEHVFRCERVCIAFCTHLNIVSDSCG